MYITNVGVKSGSVGSFVRTVRASKWFLPSVSVDVLLQVIFSYCSIWTVRTGEWFFSSVLKSMSFEIALFIGAVVTVRTLVEFGGGCEFQPSLCGSSQTGMKVNVLLHLRRKPYLTSCDIENNILEHIFIILVNNL